MEVIVAGETSEPIIFSAHGFTLRSGKLFNMILRRELGRQLVLDSRYSRASVVQVLSAM